MDDAKFSFTKLVVADALHPTEGLLHMPMLPTPGTFGAKMDVQHPYVWWMVSNQVPGLPEQLLAGRFHLLLDYLFAYVMRDERKMSDFDRAVYAHAYSEAASIRAATGWYRALEQDMQDARAYAPLALPVLALGSYVSYATLQQGLPGMAPAGQLVGLPESGHYLFEEEPAQVLEAVLAFLK